MTLPWAPTQLLDSGSRWPCLRGPWVVRFPAPKYHSLSLLHGLRNSEANVHHAITLELTRCYDDTWRSSAWQMIPQMIQYDMSCTDEDDRYTAIWYSAHVELQQYKKKMGNMHSVPIFGVWGILIRKWPSSLSRRMLCGQKEIICQLQRRRWVILRGLWLERH